MVFYKKKCKKKTIEIKIHTRLTCIAPRKIDQPRVHLGPW